MAFWNRSSTLRDAVADWQSRGLIDDKTAASLTTDILQNRRSFSFANVLVLLAVICLGLGILTFVAANWEDMSRLLRLSVLVGGLWLCWGGAWVLRRKGLLWLAECAVLLACIAFGATIMLVSQMYHMQGPPSGALLLWGIGTLLAAVFARSVPALSLAIVIWSLWSIIGEEFSWWFDYPSPALLPILVICAAVAWWLQSRFAAHLCAIAFLVWLVPNLFQVLEKDSYGLFMALALCGFPLISVLLWSEGTARWLNGFELPALLYALFYTLTLSFLWPEPLRAGIGVLLPASQFGALALIVPLLCGGLAALAFRQGHPNLYDIAVAAVAALVSWSVANLFGSVFALPEALMLALAIWTIRMGWRLEYRPVAVLGFLYFTAVILLLYFQTIGTLLGTAAFYLIAGLTLLVGVFLIPRLTRGVSK